MPFSNKDKAVIKNLYQFKEYALQRIPILTKFRKTKCISEELDILLRKFEKREAPTVRIAEENGTTVDELLDPERQEV